MSYAGPMPLIGIAGRARAGKDTAAKALEPLGYKRVGFADALKRVALEIDPLLYVTLDDDRVTLADVVEADGWEVAKDQFPEVRQFLQTLGTSIRSLDAGIWVRTAMLTVESLLSDGYGVVVPDVRFINEVDAIRRAGGIVVRVERPGLESTDTHASETELDGFDFDRVIVNCGTPDQLATLVQCAASEWCPYPLREVPRWE